MKDSKLKIIVISIMVVIIFVGIGSISYLRYANSYTQEEFYSQEQLEWGLATSAILTKLNGNQFKLVGGMDLTDRNSQIQKNTLERWWNINSKRDVLRTLEWLKEEGHRKDFGHSISYLSSVNEEGYNQLLAQYEDEPSIIETIDFFRDKKDELNEDSLLGWDYSRIVSVAGSSYLAGYLNYEEAVEEIMNASKVIKANFDSWEEVGESYLLGGYYWNKDKEEYNRRREIIQWLLTDGTSPWLRYDWDISLEANTFIRRRKQEETTNMTGIKLVRTYDTSKLKGDFSGRYNDVDFDPDQKMLRFSGDGEEGVIPFEDDELKLFDSKSFLTTIPFDLRGYADSKAEFCAIDNSQKIFFYGRNQIKFPRSLREVTGLTYGDGFFWTIDRDSNEIYKFQVVNNDLEYKIEIKEQVEFPYRRLEGIKYHNNQLWVSTADSLFALDSDYRVEGNFSLSKSISGFYFYQNNLIAPALNEAKIYQFKIVNK